jgi:hypothetical protein
MIRILTKYRRLPDDLKVEFDKFVKKESMQNLNGKVLFLVHDEEVTIAFSFFENVYQEKDNLKKINEYAKEKGHTKIFYDFYGELELEVFEDELKETYNCALDFDVYEELSKFFTFSKVQNLKLSTICGLRALGMKPVKINEFLKANELSILEAKELVDKSNEI